MSTEHLSPTQVSALIHAAARTREPARDLAILAVCIDAGPRRCELVDARRSDLDARRGLLALGGGPTRRVIRLGEGTLAALLVVAPAVSSGPLIVARDGRPVTERIVHEQLLTIGSFAGLGHWVTARHARRTFIAAVAATLPLPIAMRLADHGSKRFPPASIEEAMAAQFRSGWTSPLDAMLATARRARAA